MNFDILLDGNSIKHQVSRMHLHKGRALFCKELTLNLNDPAFLDQFDFTQIPAEPRIEVFTEGELGWISEGKFFVEEPGETLDKDKIAPTLYGRDISARLTFPFAVRISKEWPEEAMLFDILQEVIEGAGLEWDESRVLINNYPTYPSSYAVTNRYPLEIVIELVGKTDGFLYTDRLNRLWIPKKTHAWDSTEVEIHAGMIQNITKRVIQPEFGNRIHVGSLSKEGDANVNISLEMAGSYVACGESVAAKAVVTHLDGSPAADGYPVDWTSDNDDYAAWEHARTHVYTHWIPNEPQEASSRYLVSTDYPIRQVHSVTEVATGETKAVKEWKGRSITLEEPLTFTDSAVIIDYETGYAINTLVAGETGEVEVPVHAIVEVFVRDTQTMRIDTETGDESGAKAKYVTIEYFNFHNEAVIPGVAFSWDGVDMGVTGEDGQKDIGLQAGGEHPVIATKDGFKPSNLPDGLANDFAYVDEIA